MPLQTKSQAILHFGLGRQRYFAHQSEIAAAVVRAVGLDDNVATVSDMDGKTKDIRFGCSFPPTKKKLEPAGWGAGISGTNWYVQAFDYFFFGINTISF